MSILVDSFEYKCWHEVGHATACLHFGGEVESIEFLDGNARGHARTRCVVTPEMEKNVACGGGAVEFFLLDNGYARQAPDDERNLSQVVFHNASADREDYWDRRLGRDEAFSTEEDKAFMNHALEFVAPIFSQYFTGMQQLVDELCNARRLDGKRVMELLRQRSPRGSEG